MYLVYGFEVAFSGNPHLQGFLSLESKKFMTYLKWILPRAHWEVAKRIPKAISYCKKDCTVAEYGILPLVASTQTDTPY